MAFEKTIFEAKVTKITAAFLNSLQDALIAAENNIGTIDEKLTVIDEKLALIENGAF